MRRDYLYIPHSISDLFQAHMQLLSQRTNGFATAALSHPGGAPQQWSRPV